MADDVAELLPGTLDMMVLKIVSVGTEHGFGIGRRLQELSDGVFDVNQGSLYPALQRLMKRGWIKGEWRQTETGRRARYYTITRSGTRQLEHERRSFARQIAAVQLVMTWAG
jgi:transcriptional regulator